MTETTSFLGTTVVHHFLLLFLQTQENMTTEELPIGVGRVPDWWMECTPHNVLSSPYLEKIQSLSDDPSSGEGIANNHAQTDFGRYGRQAEKVGFTPSWMEKKLKKTGAGDNIRAGVYNDSPNKHVNKRMQEQAKRDADDPFQKNGPSAYEMATTGVTEPAVETPTKKPIQVPENPTGPTNVVAENPTGPTNVRTVAEVRRNEFGEKETIITKTTIGADDVERTEKTIMTEPQKEGETFEEGTFVKEQVIEAGEEAPAPAPGGEADLNDLQAILAAKQAELARLQAQLAES